jgi:hypothetical protein
VRLSTSPSWMLLLAIPYLRDFVVSIGDGARTRVCHPGVPPGAALPIELHRSYWDGTANNSW